MKAIIKRNNCSTVTTARKDYSITVAPINNDKLATVAPVKRDGDITVGQTTRDENNNRVYPGLGNSSKPKTEPDFKVCDKKPKQPRKKKSMLSPIIWGLVFVGALVMLSMCTGHHDHKTPTNPNENVDLHELEISDLIDNHNYRVADRVYLEKNTTHDIEVDNPPEIRRWKLIADRPIKLELSRGGIIKDSVTLKANKIYDFDMIDYNSEYHLYVRCIGLFNHTRVAYLTRRY